MSEERLQPLKRGRDVAHIFNCTLAFDDMPLADALVLFYFLCCVTVVRVATFASFPYQPGTERMQQKHVCRLLPAMLCYCVISH